MQSARSSRYSEKFRAGVVQRVLDGKHSLGQIANELEVPQADILVWIAQQFDRKQHQIDQLSSTIARMRKLTPNRVRIEVQNDDPGQASQSREAGDVIEGRVN